ncbi:MAG: hypothetical protein EPO02_01965 [Nitrospirae bacterium]|nr:MAG: hypothetical protein EPO02_01965 [Nitrospirota bacterium]
MDPRSTTIADLNRIARERGQRGKVATGQGLIDHTEAALVGRAGSGKQKLRQFADPTPEQMKAELSEGLPGVIRRTPRERFLVLLARLRAEAEKSVRLHGRVIWPASLQAELAAMGWRSGNPDLAGQVEALARRMFEKAAHMQAESDAGKTALDWHGHDNTSITISSAPAGSGTEGKD